MMWSNVESETCRLGEPSCCTLKDRHWVCQRSGRPAVAHPLESMTQFAVDPSASHVVVRQNADAFEAPSHAATPSHARLGRPLEGAGGRSPGATRQLLEDQPLDLADGSLVQTLHGRVVVGLFLRVP